VANCTSVGSRIFYWISVGDEGRLEELAAGFREHSGGLVDGCVMATDGFGVAT